MKEENEGFQATLHLFKTATYSSVYGAFEVAGGINTSSPLVIGGKDLCKKINYPRRFFLKSCRDYSVLDDLRFSDIETIVFKGSDDRTGKNGGRRSIQRVEIYKSVKTPSKTVSKRARYGRLKSTPLKLCKNRQKKPKFRSEKRRG